MIGHSRGHAELLGAPTLDTPHVEVPPFSAKHPSCLPSLFTRGSTSPRRRPPLWLRRPLSARYLAVLKMIVG